MSQTKPDPQQAAAQYRPQSGYCGADIWTHHEPSEGEYYQVHYDEGLSQNGEAPSSYFTDKSTIESCRRKDGTVDAQKLGEKLQVRPQANWNTESGDPVYRYPDQIVRYETTKPIAHSSARCEHNPALGEGGGGQYVFSPEDKKTLKQVGEPESATNTRAQLNTFKDLERDKVGNYPEGNARIQEAHETKLQQMSHGAPEERQKATAIREQSEIAQRKQSRAEEALAIEPGKQQQTERKGQEEPGKQDGKKDLDQPQRKREDQPSQEQVASYKEVLRQRRVRDDGDRKVASSRKQEQTQNEAERKQSEQSKSTEPQKRK